MMARASADITSRARENWLARSKADAPFVPPRVERKVKEPGSKVLINGEWVRAEDEEVVLASLRKGPRPVDPGGDGRIEGRGLI